MEPRGEGVRPPSCPSCPACHKVSLSPPQPHTSVLPSGGPAGCEGLVPVLSPEGREDGYVSGEEDAFLSFCCL